MALLAVPSFLNLPFEEVVWPFLDLAWHYDCIVRPTSRHPITRVFHEEFVKLVTTSENATSAPRSLEATTFVNDAAGGNSATRCSNAIVTRASDLSSSHIDAAEEVPRSIVPAGSSTLLITSGKSTVSLPVSTDTSGLYRPEIDPQTRWLRNVFYTFDENSDGRLTKDELRRSLGKLGFEATDESVLSLLSSTSPKQDGYIDIDEFIFLYSSICSYIDDHLAETDACADGDEDLREAFNVFDKDKDGFITPEELQSVLRDLGFREAEELEACVEMIKRGDEDGDGRVNFEEFKQLMEKSRAVAS